MVLPEDFKADTYQDWKKRVEKELRGQSFEDLLVWKSMDGFIQPSYEITLPSPLPKLIPREKAWQIIEPIFEEHAIDANKHALSALNAGSEGVWFNKSFLGAAAQVATKDIIVDIAPAFIKGGNVIDIFKPLLKGVSLEINSDINHGHLILLDGNRYRERGATPIAEIAWMLASAIQLLQMGFSPSSILFKSSYGSAFLTEIAKTRAIRWLWTAILNQHGLPVANPMILATNLTHHYPKADEHNNILRATSSAMSAIIGGADMIMINPWNHHWKKQDEFSARISRNIQLLLKEESRLDKNHNPADGSYFLENLTVKIAQLTWEKVKPILRSGGFSEFITSKMLYQELNEMRNDLIDSYKSNHKTLLGVNKYTPATPPDEIQAPFAEYALLPDYCYIPTAINE